MNRKKIAFVCLSIAIVVAAVYGLRDMTPPATSESATASATARGELTLPRHSAGANARQLRDRPLSERAAGWIAEHPPSPVLHNALLDIAANADLVSQRLPGIAEDDAAAEALAEARQERAELQTQFRADLRAALRIMSPAERAAMRAAHVHIIQLARHVASQS